MFIVKTRELQSSLVSIKKRIISEREEALLPNTDGDLVIIPLDRYNDLLKMEKNIINQKEK